MTVIEIIGTIVCGAIALFLFAGLQFIFRELALDIKRTCVVPCDIVGDARLSYIEKFNKDKRKSLVWSSIGATVVAFTDLIVIASLIAMII